MVHICILIALVQLWILFHLVGGQALLRSGAQVLQAPLLKDLASTASLENTVQLLFDEYLLQSAVIGFLFLFCVLPRRLGRLHSLISFFLVATLYLFG